MAEIGNEEYIWKGYKEGRVFEFSQLTDFLVYSTKDCYDNWAKVGRWGQVLNAPCSFDIETSSFTLPTGSREEERKYACMYIWQFGLDGSVIYGRTWQQFGELLERLVDYLDLSEKRKIYIYVHNLAYEFQFIKKWITWDKVFAIKNRRPVYATSGGLEFRCSFFLSNYALAYIGDNLLHKYPVKKLVGDLDYSKIRHSRTPLTSSELAYCINDVLVVMSYIQEKIEQDGSIVNIPLTNTGYVRNYCRKECFFEDCETEEDRRRVRLNYRALMKSLTISDKTEYDQLHRAFMGGFTHASCLHSNSKNGPLYNVGSADLTSSYPFVMVAQYFPMSHGDYIGHIDNEKLFNHYLNKYCCVFDIEMVNLRPKLEFENILSLSRCDTAGKVVTNNGRVVSAQRIRTTVTELDYDTLTKFYTWDSYKIMNMRVYERGYLPKALILAILKLYEDKTSLKGVFGKETEYLVSKNMINAAFGMMVTAIIREDYQFAEDWYKEVVDIDSQLTNYNNSFNRFLFYAWGVWVTAHARHNLFSAILEFGEDYVYSDTDSIKGINFNLHEAYFKKYNQKVVEQLLAMCNYYHIPFSKCKPCTKEGVPKLIGVWDIEKPYKLFKTVGAKRYIYQYEDGFVNMTVSGVNKKFAMPYLIAKWNNIDFNSVEFQNILKAYSGKAEDKQYVSQLIEKNYDYTMVFEEFGEGLFIPAGHTGKMTMTYIDSPTMGVVRDYFGEENIFQEMSSVHMENQSYLMSIVGDYLKFLEGIQYVEY